MRRSMQHHILTKKQLPHCSIDKTDGSSIQTTEDTPVVLKQLVSEKLLYYCKVILCDAVRSP
jgi:hypothetical protein